MEMILSRVYVSRSGHDSLAGTQPGAKQNRLSIVSEVAPENNNLATFL
jgi:hypothetical protein